MADRTPGRSARQRKRRTAARVIVYTIGGMLAWWIGMWAVGAQGSSA